MRIRLGLFVLIACGVAMGQISVVSGTITDSSGQVWANGSWSISLYKVPGNPGPYYNSGTTTPVATPYSGTLDGSGDMTATIQRNSFISPAGTQWTFQVCPQASSPCYSTNISVTTASLNLSPLIIPPPVRVNITNTWAFAYADSEIVTPAAIGNAYVNVVDGLVHYCSAVSDGACVWTTLQTGEANNTTCEKYGSLAGAISAIGSAKTILTCNTAQSLGANLTIPANVLYEPGPGAVVTLNGFTFTVAGPFTASAAQQIVSLTNGGIAYFSSVPQISTAWYGDVGDGVTDDTVAINAALADSNNGAGAGTSRPVFIPAGVHIVSGQIVSGNRNQQFFGVGPVDNANGASTIKWTSAPSGVYARCDGGDSAGLLNILGTGPSPGSSAFYFHDIDLVDGVSSGTTSACVIHIDGIAGFQRISRVSIESDASNVLNTNDTGIYVDNTFGLTIDGQSIIGNLGYGLVCTSYDASPGAGGQCSDLHIHDISITQIRYWHIFLNLGATPMGVSINDTILEGDNGCDGIYAVSNGYEEGEVYVRDVYMSDAGSMCSSQNWISTVNVGVNVEDTGIEGASLLFNGPATLDTVYADTSIEEASGFTLTSRNTAYAGTVTLATSASSQTTTFVSLGGDTSSVASPGYTVAGSGPGQEVMFGYGHFGNPQGGTIEVTKYFGLSEATSGAVAGLTANESLFTIYTTANVSGSGAHVDVCANTTVSTAGSGSTLPEPYITYQNAINGSTYTIALGPTGVSGGTAGNSSSGCTTVYVVQLAGTIQLGAANYAGSGLTYYLLWSYHVVDIDGH